MRLDDAFKKRDKAKKAIKECESVIYAHARPLILGVLEIM